MDTSGDTRRAMARTLPLPVLVLRRDLMGCRSKKLVYFLYGLTCEVPNLLCPQKIIIIPICLLTPGFFVRGAPRILPTTTKSEWHRTWKGCWWRPGRRKWKRGMERSMGRIRMNKLEGLLHRLNTLWMEHSATQANAQGAEHHHPVVSMLGGHVGQLERMIDRDDIVTW